MAVQVLLLMRNLTINLTSPEFADHVSNFFHLHLILLNAILNFTGVKRFKF